MPTYGRCLSTISSAPVVLWSLSDCPDSKSIKRLLKSYKVSPLVIELDQDSQGPDLKIDLSVLSGQNKLPSLWIDGHYVGNHVEVWYLHSQGQLAPKIQKALKSGK